MRHYSFVIDVAADDREFLKTEVSRCLKEIDIDMYPSYWSSTRSAFWSGRHNADSQVDLTQYPSAKTGAGLDLLRMRLVATGG